MGGFYDVRGEDGRVVRCRARGRFKKDGQVLLVGDRVDYADLGNSQGVLESIHPRKNQLTRPAVANIDQVILVCSPADPPFSYQLTDRLLVLAESRGLMAVICMNKIDLASKEEIDRIRQVYENAGYRFFCTSTLKGWGIEEIRPVFKDKISVLAGPSGVGKSSLINSLQKNLRLRTGDISAKLGRGRHTTRQVELLLLDSGGMVADTPGFSQLNLEEVSARALPACFPEFLMFSSECRFSGCLHLEEPGCAVKHAVAQKKIAETRYKSYLVLHAEAARLERSY